MKMAIARSRGGIPVRTHTYELWKGRKESYIAKSKSAGNSAANMPRHSISRQLQDFSTLPIANCSIGQSLNELFFSKINQRHLVIEDQYMYIFPNKENTLVLQLVVRTSIAHNICMSTDPSRYKFSGRAVDLIWPGDVLHF